MRSQKRSLHDVGLILPSGLINRQIQVQVLFSLRLSQNMGFMDSVCTPSLPAPPLPFMSVPRLEPGGVHLVQGKKVACANVSPHLNVLSYAQVWCYSPLWQLHSYLGDFSDRACRVRYTTVAENNPDIGLLMQQSFSLNPDVARGKKIPIIPIKARLAAFLSHLFVFTVH